MDKETREIIERTVALTVIKLKMAGLLKDKRKTATEKLEEILRGFPIFKATDGKKTAKLVAQVERALATIKNDPYYEVIELFYFEGQSRESIAGYFNTSPTTISRNKARLLKKIAPQLLSDDVIFEIFLT